jgi:cytochrome b subunit of formate dehydrogenase
MTKARVFYIVDVVIGISFIVVAVSGMILFFAGSGGYQGGRNPRYAHEILGISRLLWKDLHDWGGIVMMGGVLVHLAFHWKWMVRMTQRIFRKSAVPRSNQPKPTPAIASAMAMADARADRSR